MQKYFNEIVNSVSAAIRFDSTQGQAEDGYPFGKSNAACLQWFLSLAESMGFETHNYDNYVGETVWGEGEEFAILAHLDVVPAGEGWTHDPFGGEVDGIGQKIWGRGSTDDKGPAVITLYALKALKDEGFRPRKKIKFILGCNEETGWACIEHYKKVSTMPETGFSPDADFPVIYAEKGILHLRFHFPAQGKNYGLCGGNLSNMVCDLCTATAPYDAGKAEPLGILQSGGMPVSHGKSAHGSTPEKGINAIAPMLRYLGLDSMYRALFCDAMGAARFEDETGKLTFSPNLIEQNGDDIAVTCDIRYPATFPREEIVGAIEKYAQPLGVSYETVHDQAPLFNDKNSPLIRTLLGVYNEVTGKNEKPVAIGGGTYARALKYGAAFGPEEEGEPQTIHQANEYITFEKIKKCFLIYKLAIARLCG